jgi:hypothetical protein
MVGAVEGDSVWLAVLRTPSMPQRSSLIVARNEVCRSSNETVGKQKHIRVCIISRTWNLGGPPRSDLNFASTALSLAMSYDAMTFTSLPMTFSTT